MLHYPHLAILDEEGMIIAVNRSWKDFSDHQNKTHPLHPGANYLTICEKCNQKEPVIPVEVIEGLHKVIRRKHTEFQLTYPSIVEKKCHFRFVARAISCQDTLKILVIHERTPETTAIPGMTMEPENGEPGGGYV